MRELHMQPHEAAWWEDMMVINSNPAIGDMPPLPGWELCTRERLLTAQPDLLMQWEESAERQYHAPDESATEEIAAAKTDPTPNNHFETADSRSEEDALATEVIDEHSIAAAVQVAAKRKGRQKKRYEDMSRARKAVHIAGLATSVTLMVAPCTADVSTPQLYSPPSLQYADPHADTCPTGTTIGGLNMSGIGDNMIGTYSARQEANFLSDQKDVCFAGLVYGTDLDNLGNTSVFHDYIEKNNLKRVIIFAFSFGGIATIDMLNEYNRQYPNSGIDIAVVFVSSPAEFDDLQPGQQSAVKALSIAPLDAASVKTITYLSIVKNGDKNLLSKQVNDDANIAASNTPARLLWEETLRLLLGMSESDMDITTSVVYDVNDEIVNMPRAVESIVQHTGIAFLKKVPMTHSDHLMNNHAAAWWIANNKDYREPFLTVIDASRKEFERKENIRKLAQCALRGKVLVRLAC